jgi:hypothetical protein
VDWSLGSLVIPETPDEPEGLGSDESIAALLDAAEDIVNEAGSRVMADLNAEKAKKGRFRRSKGSGKHRGRKGKRRRE